MPVEVGSDQSLEEVLRGADRQSGDTLQDGRMVDRLAYWERTPDGVLAEFTTLQATDAASGLPPYVVP